MAGILSAYSKPLSGGASTPASLIITGASGLLPVGCNKVCITNLNAVQTYGTLDGTSPASPWTNTWVIVATVGWQRILPLPKYASYDDGNTSPVVTLIASSASAWSLWVEAMY